MKKCPYCGMSNASMSTVCLNCWERLDEVSDDGTMDPAFPTVNYGNPLLNADARIMSRALYTKHNASFKVSSILLAGVFISLILALVKAYEWAIIVIMGCIALASCFQYFKNRNRRI